MGSATCSRAGGTGGQRKFGRDGEGHVPSILETLVCGPGRRVGHNGDDRGPGPEHVHRHVGDRTDPAGRNATPARHDHHHPERERAFRNDEPWRNRGSARQRQRQWRDHLLQRTAPRQSGPHTQLLGRDPRQPARRREPGYGCRFVYADRTARRRRTAEPSGAGCTCCTGCECESSSAIGCCPSWSTTRAGTAVIGCLSGTGRLRCATLGAGRTRRGTGDNTPSCFASCKPSCCRQRSAACATCSRRSACARAKSAAAPACRTASHPGAGARRGVERRADHTRFDRTQRGNAELHARGRSRRGRVPFGRPGASAIRCEANRFRSVVLGCRSRDAIRNDPLPRNRTKRPSGDGGARRETRSL